MTTEAEIFQIWDYGHNSGTGSDPQKAQEYIDFISKFIKEHGVKRVCDLGCGDFEVGSRIDYGDAEVVAVDASEKHIQKHRGVHTHPRFTFVHADLRAFDDSGFDLVLVKDVLQHWPTEDIKQWCVREHGKLLLVTNDVGGGEVNGDISYLPSVDGKLKVNVRGLDLRAKPFNVSAALVLEYGGKGGKRTLLVKRD
ncbi:MAG: class I SAM-dependent methyltransferase [Acidiferrobacterales bacterium]